MSWKCKTCGESHEDQFDSCWKCGTERAGIGSIQEFEIQDSGPSSADAKLPCSTTPEIPGRKVNSNRGIVCGEAVLGTESLPDIAAGVDNIAGWRSVAHETTLRQCREAALEVMMGEARKIGGNAVVGVNIGYGTVGDGMLMASASGTAVVLEPLQIDQDLPGIPPPLPDFGSAPTQWPGAGI